MTDVIETIMRADGATGHTLVTCEIGTTDLKDVSIDTYNLFPVGGGDYESYEQEYLMETYTGSEGELSYDDFTWRYDNKLWKKMLSETLIQYLLEEQPEDIIKSIEFVETVSPKEYNFTTDAFYGNYTVDLTALLEWWETTTYTFESEMADGGRHGSCSGYFSFIDSRYREDSLKIETMMMLDRWIESWSDWDKFLSFMREGMTGNGQDQDCINYWPDTNAGLLAFCQADRIVDDEVINDFAAKRVPVNEIQVGDRISFSYHSFRTVTAVEVVESKSEDSGLYVEIISPYDDGSGDRPYYLIGHELVWRSYVPARDGKNEA
ncbi:hypothetical protein CJ179_38555 [Rhodococcus sp. ACS1]|uniref:hypothetical protein n=1 Tax=Rhodococcus sp. ACS1 TaxID=2028570 RepID=UPI000BB11901|nr:hypothetical protein [Rhodococcus sp. ACS1]PBC38502.1 hypothetical protein CJ179_38555 [Rhodococcus sp. ACS1]